MSIKDKLRLIKKRTIKGLKIIFAFGGLIAIIAGFVYYNDGFKFVQGEQKYVYIYDLNILEDYQVASPEFWEYVRVNFNVGQVPEAKALVALINAISQREGVDPAHFIAIALHESHLGMSILGDGGNAHGPFQINRIYNPEVSVDQANDPKFATEWTIQYAIDHGYNEGKVTYAIMKHNGSNDRAKVYATDVLTTADNVRPLLTKQATTTEVVID